MSFELRPSTNEAFYERLRRAELQNKPSWLSAPEWAEFLIQTLAGRWLWLSDKPKGMDDNGIMYFRLDAKSEKASEGEVIGDWKYTLEQRPEEFKPSIEEANKLAQEFKPFTSIEDNQEQDMKQDNGWFERGELPPVGTECTFEPGDGSSYFNSDDLKAKGQLVTIIAHTKYKKGCGSVAVFRWDLDDCCGVSSANPQAFIPILTEREKEIEEMRQALQYPGSWHSVGRIYAEALYDAGYRKESK